MSKRKWDRWRGKNKKEKEREIEGELMEERNRKGWKKKELDQVGKKKMSEMFI